MNKRKRTIGRRTAKKALTFCVNASTSILVRRRDIENQDFHRQKKHAIIKIMTKAQLWTRDYITICSLNFFIFMTYYVLVTMLPLYLAGVHGSLPSTVGLVMTLFLGAAIMIRPFAGLWVGQYAEKRILVLAGVAFFGATLLYPLASGSVAALLTLRVCHGVAFGILTTAKGTICAEMIPASRRAEGLSYFSMTMGLAMVMGPYLALAFVHADAYLTGFICSMALGAVSLALCLILRVQEPVHTAGDAAVKPQITLGTMFDKKALPFALAVFISACAYSGIATFLPLYTEGLGLTATASAFFIIYALFMLASRPFTGKLADRYPPKAIVLPCMALFGAGMFLISQAETHGLFLIAAALIGAGYGSLTPVLQTQTISSVDRHRMGIANSIYFNSLDGGMAIGAWVLGIVATGAGYGMIYTVAVAFIIAAFAEYLIFTRQKAATLPEGAIPAPSKPMKKAE
jgi:MFS family permease